MITRLFNFPLRDRDMEFDIPAPLRIHRCAHAQPSSAAGRDLLVTQPALKGAIQQRCSAAGAQL